RHRRRHTRHRNRRGLAAPAQPRALLAPALADVGRRIRHLRREPIAALRPRRPANREIRLPARALARYPPCVARKTVAYSARAMTDRLPSTTSTLIIGAGVHGLSSAWHLAQ